MSISPLFGKLRLRVGITFIHSSKKVFMNQRVRTYLIQTARQKEKFVHYSDVVRDCGLHADISTQRGRDRLSEVLGEVSAYENSQLPSRPLLSSLVIYKDRKLNDHGDGFYKIAQQLGKGDAKKLKEALYAFSEAEACRQFWQQDENYQRFALIGYSTETEKATGFFNQQELDFFKRWQHKAYKPDAPVHVDAKNDLMATVWDKTIQLGREILKQLEGFELDGKSIGASGAGQKTEREQIFRLQL